MDSITEKKCKKCGQWKELSEFHRHKNETDGLHHYCKSCKCAGMRNWNRENKETKQKRDKEYYQVNSETIKKRTNNWYKNNKEKAIEASRKWRAKNIKHRLEYEKEWRKNNPEITKAQKQTRRAKKYGNGGSYTAKEWRDLCDKYGNKCLCCGKETKLTIDHVIPVTKGGTSYIENIQPLCFSCNRHKSTKIIDYRPRE